jgi:asparagine synthase (glutamine-hydrolysing)
MIPQLSELLRDSIAQTLEDRVAISFSGGVDSTLIAAIAKKEAKPELFSCGTEESDDLEYAERAAKKMKLLLRKTILTKNCILETYKKCYQIVPNDLLKVELLVPVYKTAQAAKEAGHEVLLFGAGAEELFVGYERYYTYLSEGKNLEEILKKEFFNLKDREVCWIKKICRHFGLEARFPYYNKKLERAVRNISLDVLMEDREKKKIVLREVAKMLGVPEFIVKRKKRAMQYGSGIHKVIMKNANMLNAATLPQPLSSSPSI